MRKYLAPLTAAIFMALTGSALAANQPVTDLHHAFSGTNSTVVLTTEGVHFGTYADGGALGGTLITHDYDGLTLASITNLSYTFSYRVGDQPAGYTAAPYLRVFLDADNDGVADDDLILDPGYCATTDVPQSTFLTYQMVGNDKLRLSDDGCDSLASQRTWAQAVSETSLETIVGVLVSQGNSVGHDVSALLPQIQINDTTYLFGAPAAGPQGPQGETGATGATGQDGADGAQGPQGPGGTSGAAGANGSNGTNGADGVGVRGQQGQPGTQGAPGTTTIVQVPIGSPSCKGDGTRVLHVATRKGYSFVSAKATLRGKPAQVKGRAITVHLPTVEGNYNVRITAKYKKAGKTITVRSSRNLSVACG